jgi:hypothetical protein
MYPIVNSKKLKIYQKGLVDEIEFDQDISPRKPARTNFKVETYGTDNEDETVHIFYRRTADQNCKNAYIYSSVHTLSSNRISMCDEDTATQPTLKCKDFDIEEVVYRPFPKKYNRHVGRVFAWVRVYDFALEQTYFLRAEL